MEYYRSIFYHQIKNSKDIIVCEVLNINIGREILVVRDNMIKAVCR